MKVAGACTGDVTTYEWDVLNRLVRIDNPDASHAAYRYDAQGRRIEKDVNGTLTRYVYDDDAILLEYDGADALQARYAHGEEVDQPLAMQRGTESYFYHTDLHGSVRLITDAAGAVANRYDYDAFGNLEATTYETVANPYAFTARERDAESGLMFYRARYYDPQTGRFISEDPIGFAAKDFNIYRYTLNDPVNYIDPTGLVLSYLKNLGASTARGGYGLAQLGQGLARIFQSVQKRVSYALRLFCKNNRAGACQPFNPYNGQYVAYSNRAFYADRLAQFSVGFAHGFLKGSSDANVKVPAAFPANEKFYNFGKLFGRLFSLGVGGPPG